MSSWAIKCFFGACCSVLACALAGAAESAVSKYDVVWDSPSKDSSGSMPLGNGDIGLNLWVEENGDLLFYISKTDAWDENGRLVKIGRVRVKMDPNPFKKGLPFRQRLDLQNGLVEITAGEPAKAVVTKAWVDANHPAVRLEIKAAQPLSLDVKPEVWRKTKRALEKGERDSAYGMADAPHPVVVAPDFTVATSDNTVIWFHADETSIWPETLELQGMKSCIATLKDPLLGRTFGAMIEGKGLKKADNFTLVSEKPQNEFRISIPVLTAQTATTDAWRRQLEQQVTAADASAWETAFQQHCDWWHAFWDRSCIEVTGPPETETVSRAYALQRFITACAGRGAFPIKFNGSIFTVDAREPNRHFDADYRAWGGPYWFQNTRLIYWPMLGAGDFDMMRPLFNMYADALPFALTRTKAYFGHDGAFFPETMYFWGAYANDNYGWDRQGKKIADVDNHYIRWHWEGQLELIALMLDAAEFTQDKDLLDKSLLPLADAVLTFFDKHNPRDEAGKLRLKPAQALETWQDVVNPLPEIAGLHWVLGRLLALPDAAVSPAQRAQWTRLKGELPPIPIREVDGKKMLAPAAQLLAGTANSENPELYAVFPFRLYGVGKPDLDLARLTFDNRRIKDNHGWRQDDTQAAFLGLTDVASKYVAERFATKNPGSRFPAFWGPNFDWIPDQDHGCNGEMALQTMLLQTDGRKIILLPAWPKTWNVHFKLHAPFKTTIEGTYADGKIQNLTVNPPERRADVVAPAGMPLPGN